MSDRLRELKELSQLVDGDPACETCAWACEEIERLQATLHSHPDREKLIADLRLLLVQRTDDWHEIAAIGRRKDKEIERLKAQNDFLKTEVRKRCTNEYDQIFSAAATTILVDMQDAAKEKP